MKFILPGVLLSLIRSVTFSQATVDSTFSADRFGVATPPEVMTIRRVQIEGQWPSPSRFLGGRVPEFNNRLLPAEHGDCLEDPREKEDKQ